MYLIDTTNLLVPPWNRDWITSFDLQLSFHLESKLSYNEAMAAEIASALLEQPGKQRFGEQGFVLTLRASCKGDESLVQYTQIAS